MSLSDLPVLTAALGFTERNDPLQLFVDWMKDAEKSEPNDPNGTALATVDEEGLPNVRMVLLKGFDERGFVFYTNFESQKGQEILGTMKAALCFHWKIAAPPGSGEGARRRGEQGRGRCLFRLEATREPHRCLGLEAVAAARRAVSRSKPPSPSMQRDMRSAKFRARPIGRASASSRYRSNSGTTVPSACTTASSSAAKSPMARGRRRGYTPEQMTQAPRQLNARPSSSPVPRAASAMPR